MNANLMCRTAIGFFVAATTILPAAAQNCQTEDLVEALTRLQVPKDKYRIDPEASEAPCWAREILRERTLERRYVRDPERPNSDPSTANVKDLAIPPVSAVSSTFAVELGLNALARRAHAIAIGANASAEEAGAMAIGSNAIATPIEALVIGVNAAVEANALSGLAIGPHARVFTGAAQSIALGGYSYVDAPRGIAIGYRALSEAPGAIALGTRSVADEPDTVSVGRADYPETELDETILRRITNLAPGTADTDAVNYGQLQSALSAVGSSSDYFAINAGGPHAAALWTNSMALGPNSVAGASGAVALGNGATSLHAGAYAIGANAQTTRNSQFMIGTTLSNYSLPGLVNPQSRMLQSGPVQLVTVDESGTLAGDGGATVSNLYSNMAAMTEGISYLGQMVSDHALGLQRGEQDRTVLSGSLTSLDNRVTQHSTSLSDLRERISDFVHLPEEVDALGREVSENSASITAIEQTLAGGLATPEDIDGLDGRISQNTSSIETLERNFAEGAALSEETARQLDALDGRVGTNTSAIRQNAGSIQQNRADIDAQSASIERLEETASNGAVRFEAIETSMSAQANRMDGIDESISTHADRITENAERTETVKSIASENQARIARNQAGLAAQGEAMAMLQSDFERLGLEVYGLAQTVIHQAEQIETNKSGIAIANALAGSSWLQANETAALTLNAGYFEGSSALAFSGTRRLHNHWSANFAVGTDTKRGEIGARAGLRLGW